MLLCTSVKSGGHSEAAMTQVRRRDSKDDFYMKPSDEQAKKILQMCSLSGGIWPDLTEAEGQL